MGYHPVGLVAKHWHLGARLGAYRRSLSELDGIVQPHRRAGRGHDFHLQLLGLHHLANLGEPEAATPTSSHDIDELDEIEIFELIGDCKNESRSNSAPTRDVS
jgi:hypothetical protein